MDLLQVGLLLAAALVATILADAVTERRSRPAAVAVFVRTATSAAGRTGAGPSQARSRGSRDLP